MMMSKTGSNAGFSLIELMLTVCFVMLGSLLIQGSFMRSADMYGRYTHTLQALTRVDQAMAAAKEQLVYSEGATGNHSGNWQLGEKSCEWSEEVVSEGGPGLYSIRLQAHWTEGGKPLELKSELYAYKKDLV